MVDRVMRRLLIAGFAFGIPLAAAQTGGLPDPTRPAGTADGAAVSDAPAAPVGLQAVLLRPGGKSVAIINGQTVSIGDKVGDSRLVSLNAQEAVLSGPNGREVLKLAPAADKKLPEAAPAKSKTRKMISGRGEGHE
jgi:MSHA biogenesis protein MshK